MTHTALTINQLDTDDPGVLYSRYPQQTQPQGAYLELDLDEGSVTAAVNPEIGNAVPQSVWDGRCIRYAVPAGLLPTVANRLMEHLRSMLEQRIMFDRDVYDVDRSDNLEHAIETAIDQCVDCDTDCVTVADAGDWFEGMRHEHMTGLNDGTLTVEAIRTEIESETTGPNGAPLLLENIDDYLDGLADKPGE